MKLSFRSVLIAAAAFGALAVSSLAQAQAQPAAAPKPTQARPRFMPQLTPEQIAALPKWTEMTMTTRDGVKLAANVFLPGGSGPFPVVLSRTPYLKDALGDLAGYSAQKYTDAGYAFVMQDGARRILFPFGERFLELPDRKGSGNARRVAVVHVEPVLARSPVDERAQALRVGVSRGQRGPLVAEGGQARQAGCVEAAEVDVAPGSLVVGPAAFTVHFPSCCSITGPQW